MSSPIPTAGAPDAWLQSLWIEAREKVPEYLLAVSQLTDPFRDANGYFQDSGLGHLEIFKAFQNAGLLDFSHPATLAKAAVNPVMVDVIHALWPAQFNPAIPANQQIRAAIQAGAKAYTDHLVTMSAAHDRIVAAQARLDAAEGESGPQREGDIFQAAQALDRARQAWVALGAQQYDTPDSLLRANQILLGLAGQPVPVGTGSPSSSAADGSGPLAPGIPPAPVGPDPCDPDSSFPGSSPGVAEHSACVSEILNCTAVLHSLHAAIQGYIGMLIGECRKGQGQCELAIQQITGPIIIGAQGCCKILAQAIGDTLLSSLMFAAEAANTVHGIIAPILPPAIPAPAPVPVLPPSPVAPPDTTPGTTPGPVPPLPAAPLPVVQAPAVPGAAPAAGGPEFAVVPPMEPSGQPTGVAVEPFMPSVDDFCTQILKVRQRLVNMGRQLLTVPTLNTRLVIDCFKHLGIASDQILESSGALVRAYAAWVQSIPATGDYYNLLAETGIADTDYLTCLEAVRKFLKLLDSVSAHLGEERSVHDSLEAEGGVHVRALGIGSGGTETRGWGHSLTLSIPFEFGIIPLPEVVDLCIRLTGPIDTPSIGEAIAMFLANQISQEKLRCLIQLKGGRPDEWNGVVAAERERLNSEECIGLLYRGLIDNTQFASLMRGLGWLDSGEIQAKVDLAKELPGPGDIVHFMVRNIYDQAIVDTFHLDAEFDQKFRGQLKDWAKSQGLTDDVMQAHWRSHWIVPSPGQLYEMVQRLRPGQVPLGIQTTIEDVKRALGENDVLPFWRDRLIAVAYKPLGRIDLRRAYLAGAMDRHTLRERVMDLGYDPTNADHLVRVFDQALVDSSIKYRWSGLYKKNALNASEFRTLMRQDGFADDLITQALKVLDNEIEAELKEAGIKLIHKQYESGKLSDHDARVALAANGNDAIQVNRLLLSWGRERQLGSKGESASVLCGWFDRGLLSEVDFQLRLSQIGYSPDDTIRIVAHCRSIRDERARKSAEAHAAKLRAESYKERKEREKVQKAQEKSVLAGQKAQQAAQRIADKQEADLHRFAVKLAKAKGIGEDEAAAQVADQMSRLMSDTGRSREEAIEIVRQAVAVIRPKVDFEFSDLVDRASAAERTLSGEVNGQ